MSVFVAFIFIVAAFVCFFDLVQPTYSEVQTLRGKQLGEQNYLTSQTALVKQVQTTLNTYQNEAQGAANVSLAMPSGEDIAGALAQIQGIATNNNINITGVTVTAPEIQVKKTGTSSSTSPIKPLGSFAFKLTGSGSYESLKNFLSEIETNVRIFDVETFSLQPMTVATVPGSKTAPTRDAFNYSITVDTYYQTQ